MSLLKTLIGVTLLDIDCLTVHIPPRLEVDMLRVKAFHVCLNVVGGIEENREGVLH